MRWNVPLAGEPVTYIWYFHMCGLHVGSLWVMIQPAVWDPCQWNHFSRYRIPIVRITWSWECFIFIIRVSYLYWNVPIYPVYETGGAACLIEGTASLIGGALYMIEGTASLIPAPDYMKEGAAYMTQAPACLVKEGPAYSLVALWGNYGTLCYPARGKS